MFTMLVVAAVLGQEGPNTSREERIKHYQEEARRDIEAQEEALLRQQVRDAEYNKRYKWNGPVLVEPPPGGWGMPRGTLSRPPIRPKPGYRFVKKKHPTTTKKKEKKILADQETRMTQLIKIK